MNFRQRIRKRIDSLGALDAQLKVEQIRESVAKRIDSIANAQTALGTYFDKGASARPDVQQKPLTTEEIRCLVRFNHYARRFVSLIPDTALRKGWVVNDESSDVEPTEALDAALNLRAKVNRALVNANKFGGCVMYIQTDVIDAQELMQPLSASDGPIRNIILLDPEEATPNQYEGNPRSENYRQPISWTITPRTGLTEGDVLLGGIVHASRVVYVPGVELSDWERLTNTEPGYDDSVLQSAWDPIRNKTSNDQAMATLAQELKITVMKIKGLAALQVTDQAEALEVRSRAIARDKSINQMVLMSDGEELETLVPNVTGITELDEQSRHALAAAAGIAQTILFGDTPSGLNTDGEAGRSDFRTVIETFQTLRADPVIQQIYEIAQVLGQLSLQGEWSISWPPIDTPTALEIAQTRKAHAETDAIRIDSQVLSPVHVMRSRYGGREYGEEIQQVEEDEEVPSLELAEDDPIFGPLPSAAAE